MLYGMYAVFFLRSSSTCHRQVGKLAYSNPSDLVILTLHYFVKQTHKSHAFAQTMYYCFVIVQLGYHSVKHSIS